MKTLRGKPLDHWGDGLEDTYREFRTDTDIDDRLAALESLTDAEFDSLEQRDLAQWLDASQGWGDSFRTMLKSALPLPVAIPSFTARHARAFLWIHGPDQWPIVTVLNPYERLAVGYRDQLMAQGGQYPRDAMNSRPQLWWMPHGNHHIPHLQLGWWSADGREAYQLTPNGAAVHTHMSHSIQPHYVPPRPGWLRARVAGWASKNRSMKDQVGEWSPPVALTHVWLSAKARDAWTPTWIDGVPESEKMETRSGSTFAWAKPSTLVPGIPIEFAGEPDWTPPSREAPIPIDSDWTPPPLPGGAPAAVVSDDTKAWLAARAARYGNGRTGKFWRELSAALG